jgi:hypothetical protein
MGVKSKKAFFAAPKKQNFSREQTQEVLANVKTNISVFFAPLLLFQTATKSKSV